MSTNNEENNSKKERSEKYNEKNEFDIKEDERKKEKIKYDADVRARAKIREAELRKEMREEKEKEERERKLKKKKKRCNNNQYDFSLKIKYKCSAVCGKKYITYNNNKETYPFIDIDDLVIYNDPGHSNHNREASVVEYYMEGTGSKDIKKDKKVPKFTIRFTDPIYKLPFYKMLVNGVKVKTNKKIVAMEKVPYDKLKLTYSMKNKDVICLSKNIIDEDKKNRDFINKKYDNKAANAKYNLYQFVKNLEKDIVNIMSKVNEEKSIMDEKNKPIKINTKVVKNLVKKSINYVRQHDNSKKYNKKETKLMNSVLNKLNLILDFDYNTNLINKTNEDLDNNKSLIIYIYIYFIANMKKSNLKYIKNYETKEEIGVEIIKKFVEKIKQLQTNFNQMHDFFVSKFEKYNPDIDDKDKIKENIVKIVNKNRADIKRGLEIKPYTYKLFILDKIKNYVNKYFILKKEFKPDKVYLKYANKELLKMNDKLKDEEKEEKDKQIIQYDDKYKLVEPTSDKTFILSSIDDIFNKEKEVNENDKDYFFDNNVFIDYNNKLIEVKINIGLNIQDKKSKEIILKDEGKLNQDSLINSIRNFVKDFGDNLNCEVSKENIKHDIKNIKKKLGMSKMDESQEETTEQTKKEEKTEMKTD